MPFALILVGLILIVASVRGTVRDLGELLKSAFTGENNFFYWLIAIGFVGLIGYNDRARPFSRAFMGLIILAMVLSNKGVFRKFVDALGTMSDTGNTGSGAAGNTLTDVIPVQGTGSNTVGANTSPGDDNLGAPKYTKDSPEVLGLIKAMPTVMKVVANPVGTVTSVLKSVPIIGGLF